MKPISTRLSDIFNCFLDFLGGPYPSLLACFSIPLTLLVYSTVTTGIHPNLIGILDHLSIVLLFVVIFDVISRSPYIVFRIMGSFFLILITQLFFIFNTIYFRFFHTWGQLDTLKQWQELVVIWTGVLALIQFPDVMWGLLFPLLLWQVSLRYRWIVQRKTNGMLLAVVILIFAVHAALGSGQNIYIENNPLLFMVRQKAFNMYLKYGTLRKKSGQEIDIRSYRSLDPTEYQSTDNKNYPLEVGPVNNPSAPPLRLPKNTNVVLILLESVRAFEVGAYGAHPSLTPNIDKLVKEGILFKNFYGNGAQTARAEFSIHSSYFPNLSGGNVYMDNPTLSVVTLPILLKKNAYKTMWIGSFTPLFHRKITFLSRHGIDSFHYDLPKQAKKLGWGPSDEDLFNYAFDILSKSKQPFFSEIMTLSNHFPCNYKYPTAQETPAVNGDEMYQGYSRGIYYTDYALGKFFDRVRKSPLYENTVFLVVGDHGIWSFPSDKEIASTPVRQEIYFRLPFFIWSPKLLPAMMKPTLGSQIDIAPTILDMLNIHEKNSFLGTSLLRESGKAKFVLMSQDNRWNMRLGNEYVYDIGPELFRTHYPDCVWQYMSNVKGKEMSHTYFSTSEDILSHFEVAGRTCLSLARSNWLKNYTENGIEFFLALLFKDQISPPSAGLTNLSNELKPEECQYIMGNKKFESNSKLEEYHD